MKNRFYFLLVLLGMLVYSCENSIEENLKPDSAKLDMLVTVANPVGEVDVNVVKRVAGMYGNMQTVQTRSGEARFIDEVIPVKNEEGDALIYVVNYAGNAGYMILSGRNEYQPVLAYSESGHFDINKDDGAGLWLKEQRKLIENVELLPDTLRWKNRKAWNRFFEEEVPVQVMSKMQTRANNSQLESDVADYVAESVIQWRMEGYKIYPYGEFSNIFSADELWLVENIVSDNANEYFCGGASGTVFYRTKTITDKRTAGPLLQSQWNQNGGYEVNGFPAGCVAVAIGQVMRYYEYPVLYNWGAMAYNYPTDMTVKLLTEIGKKVGMEYRPEGSSATTSAACNAFRQYGYTQAKITGHSPVKVISELIGSHPVMMRGTNARSDVGHAWVCDGFKETRSYEVGELMVLDRFSDARIPEYNMVYNNNLNSTIELVRYFHMNWGWGGSKDGYFYENLVNPSPYDFSVERQNIVDIYPVK